MTEEQPTAQVDPTSNPADAPKIDENGNEIVEEGPPSVISPEIMEDMERIWSVFDIENKNKVEVEELKTIMRALDINVEEE